MANNTLTREMPDASGTRSPTPSHTVDPERSAPVLPKKSLLASVFTWLASVLRRYPFSSTILLYLLLAGGIAGATWSSYSRNNREVGWPDDKPHRNVDRIELTGRRSRADIPNQTVSIEWTIWGCGAYSFGGYEGHGGCFACNLVVDVYINDLSKPTFSYDPVDGLPNPKGDMIYFKPGRSFKMEHDLETTTWDTVPFDAYSHSAMVFVIEKATNKSLPIFTSTAGEGVSGFATQSSDEQTETNWTYDSETGSTTVTVKASLITITVNRSLLGQAFTVCLLFTNSALAVGSAYVTLLAVVRREAVNDTVFFFPVTVVLTIPALRGLYPSSPPFGIYLDTFGFFLQMIIVAICSMVLLYVVTMPSVPDRRVPRDDSRSSSPGMEVMVPVSSLPEGI